MEGEKEAEGCLISMQSEVKMTPFLESALPQLLVQFSKFTHAGREQSFLVGTKHKLESLIGFAMEPTRRCIQNRISRRLGESFRLPLALDLTRRRRGRQFQSNFLCTSRSKENPRCPLRYPQETNLNLIPWSMLEYSLASLFTTYPFLQMSCRNKNLSESMNGPRCK